MTTRKRLKTPYITYWPFYCGISLLLVHYFTGVCAATNINEQNDINQPVRHLLSLKDEFPWLDAEDDLENPGDDVILSRVRRSSNNTDDDKSIWEEIEEFYSDKNNMAMYCVLPILVLIYGGCSSIYCIHKCRQYLRRRKHKRLKEEDCDSLNSDKNDLNQDSKGAEQNRPVSSISQAWADLQTEPNGNKWNGQTEAAPNGMSPLPWQVPDKAAAAAALAHTAQRDGTMASRAGYVDDKLKEGDISLEEGRRSQARRPESGASYLEDSLVEGEKSDGGRKSHSANVGNLAAAAAVASTAADGDPHPRQQQQQQQPRRPPPVKAVDPQPFEQTRAHANLADYATNRSSAVKATDYSRFSDSRPIEIIPLSADPHLRVWDPLHNRPFGENPPPGNPPKITPLEAEAGPSGRGSGRESAQAIKDEMLARYDALSTFQMAKKAAEILKTNAVEKSPFQRKPNKKKTIFIAE